MSLAAQILPDAYSRPSTLTTSGSPAPRLAERPKLTNASKAQRDLLARPDVACFMARCRNTPVGGLVRKAVYMALVSHCPVLTDTEQGDCKVLRSTLAKELETSVTTIKAHLQALESSGHIYRRRTRGAVAFTVRAHAAAMKERNKVTAVQMAKLTDHLDGQADGPYKGTFKRTFKSDPGAPPLYPPHRRGQRVVVGCA